MVCVDMEFWRGKRVLLTGHTGFKGSWAALWLSRLGATVTGIALPPDMTPNLYDLAGVARDIASHFIDIRNREAVTDVLRDCRPQIVLHLAAQSLVRRAAHEPIETIAVNVMGTANLLHALRESVDLQAVLVVTTDKVYRNDEDKVAFSEADQLGGHEPYSASKAAADLLTSAFAESYFEPNSIAVATARGGNVLGGGDFAEDRLVPDIVRAVLAGNAVVLRHPQATRPWQYVLDCLAGYFCYTQALVLRRDMPRALNFGPVRQREQTVAEIAQSILAAMQADTNWVRAAEAGPREAHFLSLDATLARQSLGWIDRYPSAAVVALTAAWYREFHRGGDMRAFSLAQIEAFMAEEAAPEQALRADDTVDPARSR